MNNNPNSQNVLRELLYRALAYLPVPATRAMNGDPIGIRCGNPSDIMPVEKLRQEIQAALSESSGPSDSGWQPISTAPKTPARISPQSDWHGGVKHGPVILLSFWDAEGEDTCRNWGTDIGWWEPHIERGCRICKQENTEGCWRFLEDDGGHDIQPTWWRPLPAPYAT